jgi:ABC-type phosphate/phosphonate transport system substrate-binding protein
VCAINRQRLVLTIGLVCLSVLLAACRRDQTVGPTLQPTLTPTPRSTPLPVVPTAVPPGEADNPLRMVLVAPAGASERVLDSAAAALTESLAEDAEITTVIEWVDTSADALAALCDSFADTAAVAWLDGISYAAAAAQDCGQPLLQVEQGRGSATALGEAVQIYANAELEISGMTGLRNSKFCRLGFDDLYTWRVPALMLLAANVSPIDGLESVTDYDDYAAIIEALAEGDCDAAGLPAAEFDDLARGDARAAITAVGDSVSVPYAMLMVPVEVPLGVREALTGTLLRLAETDDESLQTLLGQDGLARVAPDDLESWAAFIERTDLDFAQLGQ